MLRTLKIVLLTLLGLALLAVAAAVVLLLTFDPNRYKGKIAAVVEARTGRSLAIEGDLHLTLFPWLGVRSGTIALGNGPGFGDTPMARVEAVEVRVRVVPLIHREVEMGKVVVRGLSLNLGRDGAGHTNWDDLLAAGGAKGAPPTAPVGETGAPPPAAAALPVAALAIGGVEVRDASLVWDDRQTGQRVAVDHLDLKSGPVRLDGPIHLTLSGDAQASQPPLAGHLEGEATVIPDLDHQRFQLQGVHLTGRVAGPTLPVTGARGEVTGAATLDLAAQQYRATGLHLTVAADGPLSARATVTGGVEADLSSGRVAVRGLHAVAHVEGASLPGHKADATLTGEVTGNLEQGHFDVRKLDLSAATAPATKAVAGRGRLTLPALSVDLEGPRLAAQQLRLVGEATGSTLPDGELQGVVSAALTVDLATGVATVRDLHLTALGLDLRGDVRATGVGATPVATGSLRVAPFDPRALLTRLGQTSPETADAKVLRRASLFAEVEAAADRLRLTKLKVGLDKSTLSGWLAVRDFATPAVRGELTLDGIDADAYLPPKGEAMKREAGTQGEAAAPVATPAAAAAAAATLPVEPMRGLDVDATVRVGWLKASGIRLADLRLTLTGAKGKLRLHPATAKLYGGSYAGDARLDVTGELPRVALHDRLIGVHLEPLLTDAMGKTPATGTATVEARLRATGSDPDALLATLAGDGSFALADGALTGIDLGAILRNAAALLHGRQAAARTTGDKTDFSEVTGTFSVAKGVAANRDLVAKAPLVRLAGRGEADLVKQEIDYLLTATVVESRTGQGGKELADLKGIPIPIRITGPFAAPQVRPDLSAAVKGQAGRAVEKRVQKEIDKRLKGQIPEDLQRDLQDTLKGLFR